MHGTKMRIHPLSGAVGTEVPMSISRLAPTPGLIGVIADPSIDATIGKRLGAALAILNREPTELDAPADLVLNREIGATLGAVTGID